MTAASRSDATESQDGEWPDVGTVAIYAGFPEEWPQQRAFAARAGSPEATVNFFFEPDHRLAVELLRPGRPTVAFRSVPLDFTGSRRAVMFARWSADNLEVCIRDAWLRQASNEEIRQTVHAPDDGAFDADADALEVEAACRHWIDWRRHHYANPKANPKEGRRLKTLEEQLLELERARENLSGLATMIRAGRGNFVGHLATELRAVLHCGRGYSPLLVRLAGRLEHALPVYFQPSEFTGPLGDANVFFFSREISLERTREALRPADLQDWLNSEVFYVQDPALGVDRQAQTADQIILAVATTLGSSHYDEDVPTLLEALLRLRGPISDAATELLLVTTDITVPLIEQLLASAKGNDEQN